MGIRTVIELMLARNDKNFFLLHHVNFILPRTRTVPHYNMSTCTPLMALEEAQFQVGDN